MDDLSISPIYDTPANRYLNAAAHRLSCGNMLATYKRHGFHWDAEQFEEKWQDNKNFAVRLNGEWIGFISLKSLNDMVYLRDLQLVAQWQGRGIGSTCLSWLIDCLSKRQPHDTLLRLRAFSDSPAIALYERHGFLRLEEPFTPTRAGGIIAMQRKVKTGARAMTSSEMSSHPLRHDAMAESSAASLQ
ncbi:GNAT family N-acetyltransferase [Cobetia sp. 3AK]|uniref:GNAT family N-acetyltransferase n=1 Tax=Cobetia sp. 3AK TaxID=3040020 RepID=UPI0024496EB5|nr:GNAT family N-acetyltransferase [Cobetia sp. 3AK]MDH2374679.1 GNAT family N-acetyltransferase [Cobetia sp. 3AK]